MTDLSTAAPQSMYPHQPGYVPSPPPDDMRLEPGARSHEPKFDGTHYEQAEALFAHVQKELKKHIEKTAANAHLYSQEGLRKQLAAFQHTDAAKGIDKALARVEAVHEQAKADMERVYRELTPPGMQSRSPAPHGTGTVPSAYLTHLRTSRASQGNSLRSQAMKSSQCYSKSCPFTWQALVRRGPG